MIRLTRLNNQMLVVNSDLVKYVENAPDTVLTLITGEKILVRESADEIIDRIVDFRRRLYSGLPAGGVDPGTGAAAVARRQGPEGSSSESEDCG